jgi:hypothetical protein
VLSGLGFSNPNGEDSHVKGDVPSERPISDPVGE